MGTRVGGAAVAAKPAPDKQQAAADKQQKKPPGTGSNSASCSDITGLGDGGKSALKCPPPRKGVVAAAPPPAAQPMPLPGQKPAPQPATPSPDQQAALAGQIIDELGRVRSGQIAAAPQPGTSASSLPPGFDPQQADPYRFKRPPDKPDQSSCVPYFQNMLKNFERNAALCLRDTRLMRSLTDMVEKPSTADSLYVTRNSVPELFAYFDPLDPRWNVSGDQASPNCELPLTVASQSEAFMECARVYLCGSHAAYCGLKQAEQTNTNQCLPISRACLAANPVPQRLAADPTPPRYDPPPSPAPLPSPPASQSTITGPSGPGGGDNSGGVTTAR